MEKKKILIIDDEPDYSLLLKRHLEAIADFSIQTANSGQEGIDLAGKLKPDLIVLDILMPGIDGFEALERLKTREETSGIPVIMLSCRGDAAARAKALHLYDELYLTKPIDARELKDKIEEVLKIHGEIR